MTRFTVVRVAGWARMVWKEGRKERRKKGRKVITEGRKVITEGRL
jgi:hypothetical protein